MNNRRVSLAAVTAVVVIVLFVLLVPVIEYNTNVSPPCARGGPRPCFSIVPVPNLSSVYWSISAYYFGVGAFHTSSGGYGFVT